MSTRQTIRILGRLRGHPAILSTILGALAVLMIVVGSLGVASSADDASRVRELRAGGGSVERGAFVGWETVVPAGNRDRVERTELCPRYAYTADDGVERTIVDHDDCRRAGGREPAGTVRILVDDDHPGTAFVDERPARVGRSSFAIFAWSTLVLGIALVPVTAVVAVRARRLARVRRMTRPRHADPR